MDDQITLQTSLTLKRLKFMFLELRPGWSNQSLGIVYFFASFMAILGLTDPGYLRYVTGTDVIKVEEPPRADTKPDEPIHWMALMNDASTRRKIKPQNQR